MSCCLMRQHNKLEIWIPGCQKPGRQWWLPDTKGSTSQSDVLTVEMRLSSAEFQCLWRQEKSVSALFLVFWATEEQFCAMLHLQEWNIFKSASSSWEITVISLAADPGVWKGDWVHTECRIIFYPEINECQCIYLCIFFLLWDCAVQSMENTFLLLLDICQGGYLHRFIIASFLFPLKGYWKDTC